MKPYGAFIRGNTRNDFGRRSLCVLRVEEVNQFVAMVAETIESSLGSAWKGNANGCAKPVDEVALADRLEVPSKELLGVGSLRHVVNECPVLERKSALKEDLKGGVEIDD